MINRLPLLFFISLILLLMDLYLVKALGAITAKWPGRSRRLFTRIWWGVSVTLILSVFASIFLNLRLTIRSLLLVAFFVIFISKLIILLFALADDIRRALVYIFRKLVPVKKNEKPAKGLPGDKITRSDFILKAGIAVAAVPMGSLIYGTVSGAYDYQVTRRKLFLPNLPKELDGIRIGQISDIHSGSFYNRRAVKGGVDLLLAERADLIFFTGDIVNNLANEMRDYQDIFAKVKAPLGVYSTLGNHDYGNYYFGEKDSPAKRRNLADVIKTHQNLGWDLLMNENRRLTVDSEAISIIGIENWGAGRFPKHGRMDLAVKGTEDLPVKLLLSHDPSHWRAQVLADYPQIDVMFSGHTHGMQFGVRTEEFQWSPVQYIYPEWAGHYQQGTQQLYVNVGYGFLGYPGRVGILPEITIFELKKGLADS